jgi:glycosyltransferase involved in cell wall biosynthesis
MDAPKKILFVAMQNSPHACRWINSIVDYGWDLHLFPVNHIPVLPMLRGVTIHPPVMQIAPKSFLRSLLTNSTSRKEGNGLRYNPIYPVPILPKLASALSHISLRIGESQSPVPILHGPRTLASLIRKLKPDLIHSMEFQHCGYNVLEAKKYYHGNFPSWLATNWGSDIYHYRQFDDHRVQITELLRNIDYYSCECDRDVSLAQELGLTAKVMPVMPNTGGFDLDKVYPLRTMIPTSKRKLIMIKGYQHFAGRALTALDALESCSDLAKNFHVIIFSPSPETIARAKEIMAYTDVKNITILPEASHDQMLRMFARSRIYLGVSISDAISTSALEAMAMGAFPIQTNTSCCEEWFDDSIGGYLIPPDNVDVIADRLRSALSNDYLVDNAAEVNWHTIKKRLNQNDFSNRVWSFYDEIFQDIDN